MEIEELFQFENDDVAEKYRRLYENLDGTENCNGEADLFMEQWTASPNLTEKQAQAMCAGCPVLALCRDYAIAAEEKWGVWGATRPIDRKRLKQERERPQGK